MAISQDVASRINLSERQVAAFCSQWGVRNFALFGSVLREDFGPSSDIDVLVRFVPSSSHSLFDLVRMENELSQMAGRKVGLVEREAVEESRNYIRRRAILESARTIYAI